MASPRKTDRVSLARHHHPHSPFGRAADPSHEFEFETNASPSKQNGTRPRHNYRTGTLAGAYRAVSRTSMSDEGAHMGSTPSPRRTWEWEHVNNLSPNSDNSNPPEELVDAYKRIEEDGTLANYVQWDYPEASSAKRPSGRLSRSSSRQREGEYEGGSREAQASSEAGLFDGIKHKTPPTRTTDYSRDEQRLRRVTGKDSPIFSKAKTSSRSALTADNLQRREDEEQHDHHHRHYQEQQSVSENEGERGPSLNLPRTWGSRAARRQEWLRNVSGSSGSEPQEKENRDAPGEVPVFKVDTNERPSSRPAHSSSRLERARAPAREALEERVANLRTQNIQEPQEQTGLGLDQNALRPDGAAIPNTPIVVYKNSTYTKPSATKRDSQELLRRLSRTESPKLDQIQTPDPPKLFERKIYDKTPRVTGAWIDTPMTERVVEIPSDLTKDIVPAAPPKKEEESTLDPKPATEIMPEAEQKDSNVTEDKKASSEPHIAKQSKTRPPLTRPKLPKSALETVIEDASSGKESLEFGDDTIESLQALLDDPTELKTEEEDEAAYEQKVLDRLELARRNGEGPEDYDRIESKLHSLTKHITEVKKGLDRLQGHVTDGVGDLDTKKESKMPLSASTLTSTESCKTCCTHSDTRIYAAIPLPQLWERHPTSRRLRLTKLGWATLVLLTWYVIECTMTEMYSHPLISETCTGYCLRPDAPVFPLVTVTMLWRWSHLSTILAPVITIGIAIFRLVAQLLGLWDGYMDEPAGLGNLVGEIRINGTPVAFPWLTPPSTAKGFPPSSALPAPPPPPVWTPRNEAPAEGEDDQASMDRDEYL